HAHTALVSLGDGALVLIDLRARQGLQCSAQRNHANLPSDTLLLHDLPCLRQATRPLTLAQPVWTLGALARCAMLVGALESALEQSVRYANERVQFGKPI